MAENSQQSKPLVGVIMGSDTDLPVMTEAGRALASFGIPYEMQVMSAHRTPERTHEYASTAVERGLRCIIVGAGGAAHLAGVVAAVTTLPVIGVPLATSALNGLDALLATVQMPGGIPVATMAIDKAGAVNAAIFAAQIIAVGDPAMGQKLADHKKKLAQSVAEKNAHLQEKLAAEK
jgi:5-(carboxyamino)imidazole ribonucleotide mutase